MNLMFWDIFMRCLTFFIVYSRPFFVSFVLFKHFFTIKVVDFSRIQTRLVGV